VVVSIIIQVLDYAMSTIFLVKHYGFGGIVLWIFGSSAIWRMEKQVLESDGEEVAMDFKKSIQNESNMIAVAVTSPLLSTLNSWDRNRSTNVGPELYSCTNCHNGSLFVDSERSALGRTWLLHFQLGLSHHCCILRKRSIQNIGSPFEQQRRQSMDQK
jgi:hypothetical protein